jgi:DNA-binding beta-propeller fold protein YncE
MGTVRAAIACCALALLAALFQPAHAQSIVATVPEAGGEAIAVDSATLRVYVANAAAHRVAVYDPGVGRTTHVAVGRNPRYLAVDPIANRVYVSNTGDASLTVIDGATLATTTLPINGSGPIVVDAANGKVYILRQGNNGEVTVLDARTLAWYAIDTGSHTPADLVLDAASRRLYVSHNLSGDVRAIDLTSSSDHPPNVSIQIAGHPGALAYNPNTRKVYVLSDDARGPIVAIDAATHATQRITAPGHAVGPRAIAVNARTNQVYAGFANELVIVDGTTHALTFVPTAEVLSIAADSAGGKTYVLDAARNLTVIDGFTHSIVTVPIAAPAFAVAYLAATRSAYVAGTALTVVESAAPVAGDGAAINGQGLWWAADGTESGWGLNVAQQGNTLFATWFTYDAQGRGLWLAMSSGTRVARNSYEGTLYRTTGPAFSSAAFDPAKVARIPVGTARLAFDSAATATLEATVDGVRIVKRLSRQVFASPQPTCSQDGIPGVVPNYQDLWWNAPAGSESGWGINVAHQGDVLFVTWFTYGIDGQGLWLVGSNVARTGNGTYAGTLYRTFGPPLGAAPWDASRVTRLPAGSIAFSFSDAGNGTVTYTLDGVTQSKPITRQVFAAPATVCR